MTPGTYLGLCRGRAGLSHEDVALRTDTIPAVSARSRAEWLATIEADVAPITPGWAIMLSRAFRFDPLVLDALIVAHADRTRPHPLPRICSGFGCSWRDPCVDRVRMTTCAWAPGEGDVCTTCADRAAAAPIASAAA